MRFINTLVMLYLWYLILSENCVLTNGLKLVVFSATTITQELTTLNTESWDKYTTAVTLIHKKISLIRGAFGKFLAWSFISVADLQTLSCLVSF